MGEQKNRHAQGGRHRASSRQKSAQDAEPIHQQSVGIKPAGDGQNTAGTISSWFPHKATSHTQEEEVTQTTILLFEHIEEQIGRADTKAQLTLAADALLAGTLAALGKGAAKSLLSNTSPILDRFADLVTILMFLALVCSFYWALRVITPHLRGSKRLTLMYFGRIAQMDEDDFISTFGNQTLSDLKVSTLAQVHTKARIARVKFARVRWSVNFLIVSLIFWAIIQLLFAFS